MIRLWIFIGIIVCSIFYYIQIRSQLEEVITNRIEEHNKVDQQWNFKHCTPTNKNCGKLD